MSWWQSDDFSSSTATRREARRVNWERNDMPIALVFLCARLQPIKGLSLASVPNEHVGGS